MSDSNPPAGRETDAPRPFLDPQGVDRRLSYLAAGQHAVFTVAQAVDTGLGARGVRHRVARGALHRVHQGVLSLVPPELLGADGRRMAAVLACGPGAALSVFSAGNARALTGSRGALLDVTVPTRGGRLKRDGIRVHRCATLRPCDVEILNAIPTTTVARTVFDLAEVLNRRRLERLLDEAVHLEVFDLWALQEQIEHNHGRVRAARNLKRVLAGHIAGSTRTDGPIGERMLAIIRATAGLPPPRTQFWIDLGDGEPMIQADFAWPEAKVILETDGARDHAPELRRRRDLRRDQRAARAGWHTLRVSWDQITGEPARLGATVLAVVTDRWSSAAGTEAA